MEDSKNTLNQATNAQEIKKLAFTFLTNINALRSFVISVGKFADDSDEKIAQSTLEAIAEYLRQVVESKEIDTTSNSEIENATNFVKSEPVQSDGSDLETSLSNLVARGGDRQALSFYESMVSLFEAPPVQGKILRRGSLMILVSYLEALISDLIQIFYTSYPSALPSEGRVLSLSDLHDLGSVEEAEKYLIQKEVDSILRDNFEGQLKYFEKRLKIDLSSIKEAIDFCHELLQRRNLIVHNQGIINKFYEAKMGKEYLETNNLTIGKPLVIEQNYLMSALDSVYLFGTILHQNCWRKWFTADHQNADSLLHTNIYLSLTNRRFELVQKLAYKTVNTYFSSDSLRKSTIINHAIALREMGLHEKTQDVLEAVDWSACSLKFKMAVSLLKGDEDTFFLQLEQAIKIQDLNKLDLLTWPLFDPVRETDRFKNIIDSDLPDSTKPDSKVP